jgi:hypothetical protein
MARKSTNMPNFKSEAEEADWYATPAGRRQGIREFERAIKNGTLVVSGPSNIPRTDPKLLAELLARAKENSTQAISLRVSIADIEAAKRIARRQGIGYQTVLKQAIRNGLVDAPNNKTITIPKFKTEAQEAAWWDAHPEIAAKLMARAVKSGAARRGLRPKSA